MEFSARQRGGSVHVALSAGSANALWRRLSSGPVIIEKPLEDFPKGLFFIGAPGRAHLLGGESPPQTRQGELLAGRQGCLS